MTGGLRYGLKQENEYRIAIVGDSGTFGEGVPNTEDTFTQVLENALNHKQAAVKVRVFNYGASAYSVKEMAATLQYRMLDIDPDLVVMVIIDHDFALARTPTVDSSAYLIDTRLACIRISRSTIRQTLRHVHLAYVLSDVGDFLCNEGRDVMESLRDGQLPESYLYVQRFKEIAEKHNRRYLFVFRPSERSAFFHRVSEQLRRDGIRFIDLSSLRNEFSREQFRASRFDQHPSGMVHHRIGEALADHILHNALVAAAPTQPTSS
jgi:hypothetical protein